MISFGYAAIQQVISLGLDDCFRTLKVQRGCNKLNRRIPSTICLIIMFDIVLYDQVTAYIQTMSKRIFASKQESLPMNELSRAPNCYYHKLPIVQFCTKKKCTLPLCQQCLPIHKKEHINNKQIAMQGIVEFESARSDALGAFDDRRREILAVQIKFKQRITEYRDSILAAVDSVLDRFSEDCLVADGNLEILNEIDERGQEIKRGSLKELIRYYEDIYGAEHFRKLYKMYTGDYLAAFQMQLSEERLGIISRIVKQGLRNLALPNNQTPIVLPEIDVSAKPAQISPVDTKQGLDHHRKHDDNMRNEEEEEGSEISSYQLLKSKKAIEPNIYTQLNSKLHDPQSNHPSQHGSLVSRSKSKKKKGLSLTKSHTQLPSNTLTSFRDYQPAQPQPLPRRVQAAETQRHQHRQSWRKFVNMGDNPQNEIKSVYEPSVLNPRQMREMIVKKKNASQERGEKELRTNKSVQFLLFPTSEKLGRL